MAKSGVLRINSHLTLESSASDKGGEVFSKQGSCAINGLAGGGEVRPGIDSGTTSGAQFSSRDGENILKRSFLERGWIK